MNKYMICMFIVLTSLCVIYYSIPVSSTNNKKLLISVDVTGGLANRLFGLSSNFIFSRLGNYVLSIYSVDYYKLYLEDVSFLNVVPKDKKVKMYVSLNFFEYCISTCEMYHNIIKYNSSIKIRSCHDIIPSMLKCNTFTKYLVKNNLLTDSYNLDIYKQTVEINNLIFTKYIQLKQVETSKVKYFVSKINSFCSIAVHIRYDDICITENKCNISKTMIDGYVNIINNIDIRKKCNIYIASTNVRIIKSLRSIIGSRVIEYLHGVNPAHSGMDSTVNKRNKEMKIRKIIGDISFLSNADRFLTSNLSTFSLLIYYIGAKHRNGSIKPMTIVDSVKGKIDKLQIYDHLSHFRKRNTICKPSPFNNLLVYPYHYIKYKRNKYVA